MPDTVTYQTCRYCGTTITQASDGAWEDEKGACGCGSGEHEPQPTLTYADCLDHNPQCSGEVEYRMPLSSTGRSFPRCEYHWDKRLDEQQRIERTYHVHSATPPPGYDYLDAGEYWDTDY